MVVDFNCEECGKRVQVDDFAAGRRGRCPACGKVINIPDLHALIVEASELRPRRQRGRAWLLAMAAAAAVVAVPFYPSATWWAGFGLIAVTVGAIIPQSRVIVCSLLRFDVTRRFATGATIVIYGAIGLILLGLGSLSVEAQRTTERIAADRIFEQRQAHARADTELQKAMDAADAGDIDAAREHIRAARGADAEYIRSAADKLGAELSLASSSDVVRNVLLRLPDDTFDRITCGDTLPPKLRSSHVGLDRKIASLAIGHLVSVRKERQRIHEEEVAAAEAERQRKIAAEEAKQRKAALAAEKAKKEAEAKTAAELAAREEAEKKLQKALDNFVAVISALDTHLIEKVTVQRISDDICEATITVSNLWHIRHYQMRLQDAQALWKLWASVAPVKSGDGARIRLIDLNGNEVGGSRIWGGSLIWVQER